MRARRSEGVDGGEREKESQKERIFYLLSVIVIM
jgi:hypothetical protein